MENKFKKISEIPNYKSFFEWDKYNWSKAIKFFEENSSVLLENSNVLELGSRSGKFGIMFNLCGANTDLSDIKDNLDVSVKQKLKKKLI